MHTNEVSEESDILRTYENEGIIQYMDITSGKVRPMKDWEVESASWVGDIKAQLNSLRKVIKIGDIWVDETIDDALLRSIIIHAELNNDYSEGSWENFLSPEELVDYFADGKHACSAIHYILERAIGSDGESLKEDVSRVQCIAWEGAPR